MHIILGGAFNGKRQYVIDHFSNKSLAFFEGEWPNPQSLKREQYVAIGRFEEMVNHYADLSEDEAVKAMLEKIHDLEKQFDVICICTDMSRGIVPLEKEKRRERDICGRLYQYLCKEATSVTRIWYGLPQVLKEASR